MTAGSIVVESMRIRGRRGSARKRLPSVLRAVLGISLELKLLGANTIILGVAVLAFFGPAWLGPNHLVDVYFVLGALIVGTIGSFALVRVALRPIITLERVAQRVSEGCLAERIPESIVADSDLAQLARTINQMLDSLAAARERMRKLGAEVIYVEERQRAAVARELHDTVGQTLAAATFQVSALANELGSHDSSPRLAEVRDLLRESLEGIRDVSRSLHPRVATDLGLPSALEALGDATQDRSLISVRVNIDISGVVLPSALSSTLYRVAQEALHNVERHADASRATLSLTARPGYVQLEISDDGRGDAGPPARTRDESGLATIRERLSLAGGELHIDRSPEGGTRVLAWVGIDTEAA